jgi:uncharacterized protein (TIGR00255 family)
MRSMTGFGRGLADTARGRVTVEIRSVNHRGLDLKVRARGLRAEAEAELWRAVRAQVKRGSVTVFVDVTSESAHDQDDRLVTVFESLRKLQTRLGISTPANLDTLAAFVALGDRAAADTHPPSSWDWAELRPAVADACAALGASRERDGREHHADLSARHAALVARAARLRALCADLPARAATRLHDRVNALAGPTGVEPSRLAQEIALLADRLDVTEELVRLDAHLTHLGQLLALGPEPAAGSDADPGTGRKLEFWVQEIGREVNTIASKSQDAAVSAEVVEAKADLERIREQAQNIE